MLGSYVIERRMFYVDQIRYVFYSTNLVDRTTSIYSLKSLLNTLATPYSKIGEEINLRET